MTGPGRNRLLSALLIPALAFFIITISSLISVDAGMPAEEKTEGKDTLTVGKWYDGFKADVKSGTIQRQNPDFTGWMVPAWWVQLQAGRYAEQAARSGRSLDFVIIVTDEKGTIVDPEKYRLYIRGFRSYESFCEDFPPINYPE